MPPLAHPGHWIVDGLYLAPVILFLAWLGYSELRSRREKRGGGDPSSAGGDASA